MAKPNFKFQKRQKELERKRKQDEKLLRKQEKGGSFSEDETTLIPHGQENVSLPV